ncbi:hypothetical protein SDC9_168647 [bioreactor metagenome]|uniref:Uncharacterized protein n=1 Tax=bioreactor metagenome TaxID=1076179 RepID=A0A645G333_9ZZZZ
MLSDKRLCKRISAVPTVFNRYFKHSHIAAAKLVGSKRQPSASYVFAKRHPSHITEKTHKAIFCHASNLSDFIDIDITA